MKLDTQDFLRLTEHAGTFITFDTEATGLAGDYGSMLVFTAKPYGGKPVSYYVDTVGKDRAVVKAAKAYLESKDCWCGYFSKGYDVPMLNARLLKWGLRPIEKRPHLDLYYTLKSRVKISRRSQGHYLSWLNVEDDKGGQALRKMGVSPDVWASIASNPKKHLPEMIRRCESDVAGLEGLYKRVRQYIGDIGR